MPQADDEDQHEQDAREDRRRPGETRAVLGEPRAHAGHVDPRRPAPAVEAERRDGEEGKHDGDEPPASEEDAGDEDEEEERENEVTDHGLAPSLI